MLLTLFRLGLNISTTRSILSTGDAGKVVETFGSFVVGGNILVGLVVFLILIIIQFIVITKGAERVSEVAARFTLDAMPGKQMSIDADLNAGMLTESEARNRREKVAREADFYGAMDGASKFVKGDAIAGIIIIVIINIFWNHYWDASARNVDSRISFPLYAINGRRRDCFTNSCTSHFNSNRDCRHKGCF
ncbi:hypothetical protein BsIDN1_29940 [Bacillus safensis]|uniref:Flagellar biosynthesis protein FlhA n=1 Tax=Bacillus safensis TaxID=561879 RepID=A0A5S9MCX9_BACIA|nr:hypothetical protein BsIDN1_29940 [Bacillus safensis]